MMHLPALRSLLASAALLSALAACTTPPLSTPPRSAPAQLAAFSTTLSGLGQVPPVPRSLTSATGRVDAVLDKNTRLLRWKLSYRDLTGEAVAGHFHGPASIGIRAGVVIDFRGTVTSPMEGQVTLNPAQAADLLAGKWYVDIHTLAFPAGEIRGQMTLRE
jgi:hypothetical protein